GQHLRYAELRRAPRGRGGTTLDDGFQAADRREHHGNPDFLIEKNRGNIHVAHIPQDAGAEGDRIERQPVAAHRGFGLGAADEVAPGAGLEVRARGSDDFLEGEEWFGMWSVHGAQGYHSEVNSRA